MDKKGVVRTVSGNTCTVYLYDEKRDVSVSINNVDPGEPVKQDKVCCHSSYNLYIYNLYRSANCCPNTAHCITCDVCLCLGVALHEPRLGEGWVDLHFPASCAWARTLNCKKSDVQTSPGQMGSVHMQK